MNIVFSFVFAIAHKVNTYIDNTKHFMFKNVYNLYTKDNKEAVMHEQ